MVSTKLRWNNLTRRLVLCLKEKGIKVKSLYLFGSQARREAKPDSDIDILLVSPTFARSNFVSRCGKVGEAIGDIGEPVEVYPVSPDEFRHPEPGGFLEAIADDLIRLYPPARKKSR